MKRVTTNPAIAEYSSVCPFSEQNRWLLVIENVEGGGHLDRFSLYHGDGTFAKRLSIEVNAGSEPRWSRTDPDVFYYLRGNAVKRYNVATDEIAFERRFHEYSLIIGRGESDISASGDYLVLVGDGRYIFTYHVPSGAISGLLDTDSREFNNVYLTPDSNVLVSWSESGAGRYQGVELFDRGMNFLRQVTRAKGHMDAGRDWDGDEVLVWTNSDDRAPLADCLNGIVKVKLRDSAQQCLMPLDWKYSVHISCSDVGTILVSAYPGGELIHMTMGGKVLGRFSHGSSASAYSSQPRASISRDGTRAVFTSDVDGMLAVYLVTFPAPESIPAPAPAPVVPAPVVERRKPHRGFWASVLSFLLFWRTDA